MSHIPASAMPHAQPHDTPSSEPANDQAQDGVRDMAEQANDHTRAAAVRDTAEQALDKSREALDDAAAKGREAAKAVASRATALPTYVKLIGAAALVGAAAAAVIVPILPKSDDGKKPARKSRKEAKRKS